VEIDFALDSSPVYLTSDPIAQVLTCGHIYVNMLLIRFAKGFNTFACRIL
jgi:hypothetical protein